MIYQKRTALATYMYCHVHRAHVHNGVSQACAVSLKRVDQTRRQLIRLNRGVPRNEAPVRGGLAAWQQRVVTSYVEEHLPEQIPLAALAGLARLSTYYFCRAFKQSFGVPPHRYHTSRRIEQAKVMLAARKHSVTEIGLTLGFSDTSSFTAAFRKITGQTPSSYQRSLQ